MAAAAAAADPNPLVAVVLLGVENGDAGVLAAGAVAPAVAGTLYFFLSFSIRVASRPLRRGGRG